MKKYRGVIAAAIVLVAVVAAYLLLMNSDTSVTDPESESTAPIETSYLIDIEIEDVKSLTIENEETFTIFASQGSEEEGILFELEDDGHSYINNSLGPAVSSLTYITIDAEPIAIGNLNQYGLDTPTATVTVETTSEDIVFEIGDPAPGGSEYYAKLANSEEVHLISASSAGYALDTKHQFRDRSVFGFDEGTQADAVTSFTLSRLSGPTIDIERIEGDASEFAALYTMTTPIVHEINDTVFSEDIMAYFMSLYYTDIVEDSPQDLEKYGIPNEVIVTEEVSEDTTEETAEEETSDSTEQGILPTAEITVNEDLVITLGDFTDETKSHYYATVSGIDSVVTFPASTFSFIDIDYVDLLSSLLWLHNIVDVESVDMITPSGTHKMELTHIKAENEDESDSIEALLDGELIEEDFAKDIYISLLSITLSSDIEAEQLQVGETLYTFTINLMDGNSYTMEYYRINERQYGVVNDGNPLPFYVNIDLLTYIEEIISDIKDGTHTG